jgi:hypothetical protein
MASSRMREVPMPTRAEQLARVAQLEREATGLSVFVEPECRLIREAQEERDRYLRECDHYLALAMRKANPLIKPIEEPSPRRPWWRRLAG